MASLTVRQLDDRLKRLLRLRAARHGRSMKDEVCTILAHAAQDADQEAQSRIGSSRSCASRRGGRLS